MLHLIDLNQLQLDNTAEIYRALSHPLRLAIMDFIDKNEATSVNNIYSSLALEQSITSQHLRILRLSNLVLTQREGKNIIYSLNYPQLKLLSTINENYFVGKK
jgi:ArsR family transcriptional regulator